MPSPRSRAATISGVWLSEAAHIQEIGTSFSDKVTSIAPVPWPAGFFSGSNAEGHWRISASLTGSKTRRSQTVSDCERWEAVRTIKRAQQGDPAAPCCGLVAADRFPLCTDPIPTFEFWIEAA